MTRMPLGRAGWNSRAKNGAKFSPFRIRPERAAVRRRAIAPARARDSSRARVPARLRPRRRDGSARKYKVAPPAGMPRPVFATRSSTCLSGAPRDDPNGSAAAVIFPGVIEEILHDQRLYILFRRRSRRASGISVSTWRSAASGMAWRSSIHSSMRWVRSIGLSLSRSFPASIRERRSKSSTTPVSR